jgi:hypothetical protein
MTVSVGTLAALRREMFEASEGAVLLFWVQTACQFEATVTLARHITGVRNV